ncbi:Conserved membrane protein of uncharacterised function [Mycobacterium tuberculosis]|nr:Conserved membrane protein of uncharacterised function [Mycobacterium tuberculosis]
MDVLSAVLLALLLIGANAFFVGAEFALISARRDRLEALAEQGKATAVTVIRAGEQLPAMLTGAQLGVTVSSILLGRVGEPAVVKLLQLSFGLSGVPPALLHTLSLAIVVALHVVLGEMVPKNIALAGPERTAMLLVPPYLVYVRLAGRSSRSTTTAPTRYCGWLGCSRRMNSTSPSPLRNCPR